MNEPNSSLEHLINTSKKIAIIPSQVAGYDAFAAGLGLFLCLKEKNNNISFVYPGEVLEGFEDLISNKDIMTDPSIRDLTVSIDYKDSLAQKVDYSTFNDILTLKISPINSDFKLDNVKSRVEGPDFDLIIVVGAPVKEDLGIAYSQLESEFRKAIIVNMDNTAINTGFGNINIIDITMYNLSQLALNTLVKNGFSINQNAAKALLKGISYRIVN